MKNMYLKLGLDHFDVGDDILTVDPNIRYGYKMSSVTEIAAFENCIRFPEILVSANKKKSLWLSGIWIHLSLVGSKHLPVIICFGLNFIKP